MEYKIRRFESLDSTNSKAKELAIESEEGTVIVAEEQTQGRGRLGRPWLSSKGKGLFMSIILKPDIAFKDIPKLSLIASAAVNMALKDLGLEAKIKWPNDIVAQGRKLVGILIETKTKIEGISHVIVGIGVNVNQTIEDFPMDIVDKASSLRIIMGKEIDLDLVLSKILEKFKEYYMFFRDGHDYSEVLKINREDSALIGREVYIIDKKGRKRKGLALDISPKGELVVDFDGRIEKFINGQVSIRGLESYI